MPVLGWGEGIISCKDGLHLFQVGVAIKGGVTAQQEVGDYADGPYISSNKTRISNSVSAIWSNKVHTLASHGHSS